MATKLTLEERRELCRKAGAKSAALRKANAIHRPYSLVRIYSDTKDALTTEAKRRGVSFVELVESMTNTINKGE